VAGNPGELMDVSIATQSFRYEILPDVWACTLCAPPHCTDGRVRLVYSILYPVAYPGILFGGAQQIQLRTEDRENRDLEAAAP